MTFKKNLLVVVGTTLFICIMAYLLKMPRDVFVYGLFVWIGGSVLSLAAEDWLRKLANKEKKVKASYMFGLLLVACGVMTFLGSIGSDDTMEFFGILALAVFFGILGSIVFHVPNKPKTAEERYAEKWDKAVKKIAKAKTKEGKIAIASRVLRYRLTGDTVDGALDFDQPLAMYEDNISTLSEMVDKKFEAGTDGKVIEEQALRYINALIKEVE